MVWTGKKHWKFWGGFGPLRSTLPASQLKNETGSCLIAFPAFLLRSEDFPREEKSALIPFCLGGSEGEWATSVQVGEFSAEVQPHNFKVKQPLQLRRFREKLHGWVGALQKFWSTIPIILARAGEQASLCWDILLQLLIIHMRFRISLMHSHNTLNYGKNLASWCICTICQDWFVWALAKLACDLYVLCKLTFLLGCCVNILQEI